MGRMRKSYRGKEHAWIVRTLVRRDGAVCGVCGEPIETMKEITVDHKVPRSRGGSDELPNLQPAHEHCNRDKNDMTDEEWAEAQCATTA